MQNNSLGKLNIILAVYGLKTVTELVSQMITDGSPQTLSFTVKNSVIGEDGWKGQLKTLVILYNYDGGSLCMATAIESEVININPASMKKIKATAKSVFNDEQNIIAAAYGPDDVTYKVQKLVSSYNTLSFVVSNNLFGDPWYGVAKTLVVVLGYEQQITDIQVFVERERCYIDLNEFAPVI